MTSQAFHEALTKEKHRADRTFAPFTLLLFDVNGSRRDPSQWEKAIELLAKITSESGRASDTKGWYRNGSLLRVGVILNGTPPDRSQRVINNIKTHFRDRISKKKLDNSSPPDVLCEIWGYPNGQYDYPSIHQPKDQGEGPESVATIVEQDLLAPPLPVWKRTLDIIGASVSLMLSSPVVLTIAIAIKLTSQGPVIFKQKRAGFRGKPFEMYKFRSMVVDAEAKKNMLKSLNERAGPTFKIRNDPRVTPIGRFIRRWSLDELPQLVNVLKGDMSLVGPRPPTLDEVPHYEAWQQERLNVTPGITGLWQTTARHDNDFQRWVRLDINYARKRSLLLDLTILLLTLPAVVSRKGAY